MTNQILFTSYGAAEEVTGSKHLLEYQNTRVLLDCGMFQGKRMESFLKNQIFGFDPTTIDAVFLSHAHIDHCGLLPRLVKQGFSGKIYCSPSTTDLLSIMLYDSAKIQEADAMYYQKHPEIPTEIPKEPLYTELEVDQCLNQIETIKLNQPFKFKDITVVYYEAGHVIGSVQMQIKCGNKNILFSGDLGRNKMPLLIDRQMGIEANIAIMESTYGGRFHDPVDFTLQSLESVINETARKGGKIIIPSFALERTQEVLYFLEELLNQNKIPNIPIYVDSPMAINVTNVFQEHSECYDTEMREHYAKKIPFKLSNITYTETVEDSKNINTKPGPAIIISASGMCEAGRIRHHLKNNISDHRNTVLIVGYMAEGTLGRKLIEKAEIISIFGETFRVKAKIVKLNSFSGHADETDLISWEQSLKGVNQVILVHGEPESQQALAEKLQNSYTKVTIAKFSTTIEL